MRLFSRNKFWRESTENAYETNRNLLPSKFYQQSNNMYYKSKISAFFELYLQLAH